MHPQPSRRVVAVVPLFVVALLGTAPPAHAQATPVTSTADFALTGPITAPGNACLPTGDTVSLRGTLRVLTQVQIPPDPILPATIRIVTNLADASGTGASGILYHAAGAAQALTQQTPRYPILVAFSGVFDLVPVAACRPGSVTVQGQLLFNSDGSLNVGLCGPEGVCTHVGFVLDEVGVPFSLA